MNRTSKADWLSTDEAAIAAAQGWSLSHVYDLKSEKWIVQVYGQPSSEQAGQFVVGRARAGDALAQKALRLVMASHQQGTT